MHQLRSLNLFSQIFHLFLWLISWFVRLGTLLLSVLIIDVDFIVSSGSLVRILISSPHLLTRKQLDLFFLGLPNFIFLDPIHSYIIVSPKYNHSKKDFSLFIFTLDNKTYLNCYQFNNNRSLNLNKMTTNPLKEGVVSTYQVLQNTIVYQVRLTSTNKGLWMCIEESGLNWKLTITAEMIEQTVAKASASKETMNLKEFTSYVLQAISKSTEKWSIGIMTPVQLQVLRGGAPSKQTNNNKIYLILSDKEKKLHYPFTFIQSEVNEKDKLIQTIKTMKTQLQQLRAERNDKSQSSFSIMSETYATSEQIKMQNEQLKRKIKIYEESLTQKRGAVEIDLILKEKNNLQILAETKKRQEQKEITRLKNIYQLMDRQIHQIENQVELINRELLMLEDSVVNTAKIKTHALKVLRSYETELRTQKKVYQKQTREIENLKRNILTSKNNQRRVLGKIKQIQTEIDQAKKKTNIKEISNRLHSAGRGKGPNSVDSASSKSQSVGANSVGKPQSDTSSKRGNVNLVRENLLRKNMPMSSSNRNNNLLQTSPNILPNNLKKTSSDKVPGGRAINSSHQATKTTGTNPRLFNTQKYTSASKSQNDSIKSQSLDKKKEITPQERERQRKAMQRLAGPRAAVPKAPSAQKKTESANRVSSQTKGGNSSLNKAGSNRGGSLSKQGGMKKENAQQLLLKMKQIKAHYNNQANKNVAASKNMINKISQLTDKK